MLTDYAVPSPKHVNILRRKQGILLYGGNLAVFLTTALNFAIMLQVASVLGLLIALPMAFIVVMTQVNTLQNTARTLVPAAVDPVFGSTTFVILLLALAVGTITVIGAGMLMFQR